jgi:hypothetical protein
LIALNEGISMRIQPMKNCYIERSKWALVIGLALWLCPASLAQTNIETSALYSSGVDNLVTIRKVAVLPFVDNLNGIYARPLENHMFDLFKDDHHWDLLKNSTVGPVLSPYEISQDPERASEIAKSLVVADAFFAAKVTKGPSGINMHLALFLTKDGKLFAEAKLKNSQRFDIEDLKNQLKALVDQIKKQVPYAGRVLSRTGQTVTVNLGSRDGVIKDQVVPVVQIIKLKRHPKFQFLISTEKEILGRIKLLKIDKTLSFGKIITEREREAIQVGAKVASLDFVNYPDSDNLGSGGGPGTNREDKDISFGENPKAWVPQNPPAFGKVSAVFGLGQFSANTKIRNGDSYSASTLFYPKIGLAGELWLTSTWSLHLGIQQGIISMNNASGAEPSELAGSMNRYDFAFGYYFRMGPSIWDSWVQLLGGYSSYRLFLDDSDPTTFTTAEYTGFRFGVEGQFPISKDKKWSAGGKLLFTWEPNLNETPVTSGSSSNNTVNEFVGTVGYRYKSNIQFFGNAEFNLYSSTFSGGGTRTERATSYSQLHTMLIGGLNYFF